MRAACLSKTVIMQNMIFAVLLMLVMVNSHAAGITWHTYSSAAFKEAKDQNKEVLLYGYTKRCPYCARMNSYTFASDRVVELINKKYIAVKIITTENAEVADKYGMYIVPTILILNADGSIVNSIYGYQDPSELISKL